MRVGLGEKVATEESVTREDKEKREAREARVVPMGMWGLTSATTAACTSESTGASESNFGDVAAGASSGAGFVARSLGNGGKG